MQICFHCKDICVENNFGIEGGYRVQQSLSDVPVQRKVAQYFWRDGLTEMRWGLVLLSVSGPNAAHHVHLPSFENPFVLGAALLMLLMAGPGLWWARQRLSYPRLGVATRLTPPHSLYLLMSLIIVGTVVLLRFDVQGRIPWGAELVILLYPLWLARIAYQSQLTRFWAGTAILLIAVCILTVQSFSPYATVHLQVALTGGVLICTGVMTFLVFLQRYPVLIVEELHAHQ
jgi:hypothetical protein